MKVINFTECIILCERIFINAIFLIASNLKLEKSDLLVLNKNMSNWKQAKQNKSTKYWTVQTFIVLI